MAPAQQAARIAQDEEENRRSWLFIPSFFRFFLFRETSDSTRNPVQEQQSSQLPIDDRPDVVQSPQQTRTSEEGGSPSVIQTSLPIADSDNVINNTRSEALIKDESEYKKGGRIAIMAGAVNGAYYTLFVLAAASLLGGIGIMVASGEVFTAVLAVVGATSATGIGIIVGAALLMILSATFFGYHYYQREKKNQQYEKSEAARILKFRKDKFDESKDKHTQLLARSEGLLENADHQDLLNKTSSMSQLDEKRLAEIRGDITTKAIGSTKGYIDSKLSEIEQYREKYPSLFDGAKEKLQKLSDITPAKNSSKVALPVNVKYESYGAENEKVFGQARNFFSIGSFFSTTSTIASPQPIPGLALAMLVLFYPLKIVKDKYDHWREQKKSTRKTVEREICRISNDSDMKIPQVDTVLALCRERREAADKVVQEIEKLVSEQEKLALQTKLQTSENKNAAKVAILTGQQSQLRRQFYKSEEENMATTASLTQKVASLEQQLEQKDELIRVLMAEREANRAGSSTPSGRASTAMETPTTTVESDNPNIDALILESPKLKPWVVQNKSVEIFNLDSSNEQSVAAIPNFSTPEGLLSQSPAPEDLPAAACR